MLTASRKSTTGNDHMEGKIPWACEGAGKARTNTFRGRMPHQGGRGNGCHQVQWLSLIHI
eukprot:13687832-Ditylum_brightwellii.AAC.1